MVELMSETLNKVQFIKDKYLKYNKNTGRTSPIKLKGGVGSKESWSFSLKSS